MIAKALVLLWFVSTLGVTLWSLHAALAAVISSDGAEESLPARTFFALEYVAIAILAAWLNPISQDYINARDLEEIKARAKAVGCVPVDFFVKYVGVPDEVSTAGLTYRGSPYAPLSKLHLHIPVREGETFFIWLYLSD